jgi:DCN1-like protein 1/2
MGALANYLFPIHRADTIAKQRSHVGQLRAKLAKDTDYFRRVYRYAFPLAKQETQRIIPLDTAIEYWRMIFAGSPPGRAWATTAKVDDGAERHTPWFDYFVEYLQSPRWSKAINRDQWNQTFEFHRRTLEDPSLAWWNKSDAWPLMLDGFAIYVHEKWGTLPAGGVKNGGPVPC